MSARLSSSWRRSTGRIPVEVLRQRLQRVARVDEVVRADKGAQLRLQFVQSGQPSCAKKQDCCQRRTPPQADVLIAARPAWSLAASRGVAHTVQSPTVRSHSRHASSPEGPRARRRSPRLGRHARRRTRWSRRCSATSRSRAEDRVGGAPSAAPAPARNPAVDLDGRLVFPGLRRRPCPSRQGAHLGPGPQPERDLRRGAGDPRQGQGRTGPRQDLLRRAGFALRCAWEHGTRVVRTHVDTWLPWGEENHAAMHELREAWRGRIALQTVPLDGDRELFGGRGRRDRRPCPQVRGLRPRRMVAHDAGASAASSTA